MDASGDYKGIHLWITLWKRDRETFSTARPWFEHLVRIPLSHLIGVGWDTEWANLGTNRLESDDSWYNRSWSCDWCEEGGGSQWIRTIWSNAGVDLEIYEAFRASFLKADAKYMSSRLIVLAPHIVGPVGCPASACISLHFQPLQHLHSVSRPAMFNQRDVRPGWVWFRNSIRHQERQIHRVGAISPILRGERGRPQDREFMPGRTKEYENDQARSPIIRHPYRINDTMILKMIIVLQRSTTSSRIWWKIFWSKRCEQQEVAFKAIISEALVISSRIDFVCNQSSILLIGRACSPPYKGTETRISSWKGNSEAKLHLSLRARTVGITNLERDHCGSWRRYGFIRLRKPVPISTQWRSSITFDPQKHRS